MTATIPATAGAAASGPYEPNDAIVRAFGPLVSGQTYSAAVEVSGDPDWYHLATNAAGTVQLSLTLSACGTAAPGTACSNVQLTAYDGEGGIVARGVANAVGQTLSLSFEGKAAGRVSIEVRSAGTGTTYDLAAAFPSAGAPAEVPPVKYPDLISPFRTRFELTYTGSAARPRNRRIAGLVVQDVAPGSVIIVRCTSGCAKRYRKTVTARGTNRRLGGLPLALRKQTRLRIEVRRPGYVGRFKVYGFTAKVPAPRPKSLGCTSPYDFATIPCAPGA